MKLTRAGMSVAALAAACLTLASCGNDNPTGTSTAAGELQGSLNGSGASSQEAAMAAWEAGYSGKQPGVTLNYNPIGSGGGRENLIAGAVQFAGSDAALDEDEREAVKEQCGPDGAMNLPVYISPIALPYNLEGVDELRLKPATIAAIFDQKITRWNDPQIAADNPDANLPDRKITVVNRSDESGTTENFTEYLSEAAAQAWPHEADKSWPVGGGEAAAQTPGVIGVIRETDGAIGYADASAVGSLKSVQVGVGDEYVAYSAEAAAKVVDASEQEDTGVEGDLALKLERDTSESGAYPIVLVSYQIVCKQYKDQQTADMVKDFTEYVASEEGQQAAADAAGSAPISAELRGKISESLSSIKAAS